MLKLKALIDRERSLLDRNKPGGDIMQQIQKVVHLKNYNHF